MANSEDMKRAIDKVAEDLMDMTEEELKTELESHKSGYWHDVILHILEDKRKYEIDEGSKALIQLASEIKNMSNEDYNKLFEEVEEQYKSWPDNFDYPCGICNYYQYQFPWFPYFSIEVMKESSKVKAISLGIFKNKLYVTLDLT